MADLPLDLISLCDRVVDSAFAANPALARADGDHAFDGAVGDVGKDVTRRRTDELLNLSAALSNLDLTGLPLELRADVATARQVVRDELFHLQVLRDPATDPQWALWRGADVSSYISRPYAPLPDRITALARHLEQLPAWLPEAAALLTGPVAAGPRQIAVDSVRGCISFYRDEISAAVVNLGDSALRARLNGATEAAIAACERHAKTLEALPAVADADAALGAERFCATLAAQEGVNDTASSLRARCDAEMDSLSARLDDLAGRLGYRSPGDAYRAARDHRPTATGLIPAAQAMLDGLRKRWREDGSVPIPDGVECVVRPTPSFLTFIDAAYEPPGPLETAHLPHFYFVTPVDPAWDDRRANEWLEHFNLAMLLNVSIHEVYPGHFVHTVVAHGVQSRVRRMFWYSGFGEGWAHYTEALAIERGFGDLDPHLELSMVQDALLRACRFNACIGMHCEGVSLETATATFMERAHMSRLPAGREALRGTFDPMYLVYTYGKLEILRWRRDLVDSGRMSLRSFHDRILGVGHAPLSVVHDTVMAAADEGNANAPVA